MKGLKIMKDNELIKLVNVGILSRDLIKLLEDLLSNIEDTSINEIIQEYKKELLHCFHRFVEKMLPKIKSERN